MENRSSWLIAMGLAYACGETKLGLGTLDGAGNGGESVSSGGGAHFGGSGGAGLGGQGDAGSGGSRSEAGAPSHSAGAGAEGGSSPAAAGAFSNAGGGAGGSGGGSVTTGGKDPGTGGALSDAGQGAGPTGGRGAVVCGAVLQAHCAEQPVGGIGGSTGLTSEQAMGQWPVLDFGEDVELIAINASGQMVGGKRCADGGFEAFVYRNGNVDILADGRNTPWSQVIDINDNGVAIGRADGIHVMWRDGVTTALADLDGEMLAINNQEQILVRRTQPPSGYIWKAGARTEISGPAEGTVKPYGINNLGQVVGSSDCCGAFVWKDGVMTTLPDFDVATALNDHGQIIGQKTYMGVPVSSIWPDTNLLWDGQRLIDLDAAAGEDAPAQPVAISPDGTVVGRSFHDFDSYGSAFIYSRGEYSLLWGEVDSDRGTAGRAFDISANNVAIGWAGTAPPPFWWRDEVQENYHAFVWSNDCFDGCCP